VEESRGAGFLPRVLIVDDDVSRARALTRLLSREYDCHSVETLDGALAAIGREPWAAAIVDYSLADRGSGIQALRALRELAPRAFRVLYSVYYSDGLDSDARLFGHAHAVVDARDARFLVHVRESLEKLLSAPEATSGPSGEPSGTIEQWVAKSPASKVFLKELVRAAEASGPVYVVGEPGSGKRFAVSVFQHLRRQGPVTELRRDVVEESPVSILLVPPLRERPQDLPPLADLFLADHARETGEPPKALARAARDNLLERAWWGNVRELQSVLRRAWSRGGARGVITGNDLPEDHEIAPRPSIFARLEGEREALLRELQAMRSVQGAARLDQDSRQNFQRRLRRVGIIRADARPGAGDPADG
jgi:DNA-binding NtrC family response regulator